MKVLNNDNKLLTRQEVSEILGTKKETLAIWACAKRYDLPYIKVGRYVRYKQSDVENFLNSRRKER